MRVHRWLTAGLFCCLAACSKGGAPNGYMPDGDGVQDLSGGQDQGGQGDLRAADLLTADLATGPQAGLAAWYRFEDTTGQVLDSSGNGNHGTVEGGGIVRGEAGRVGLAVRFTGTDGRIRVPASASLNFATAATVELWLRLQTVDSSVGSTVSRGTGNSDDNAMMNSSCGNIQMIFSRSVGGTTNVTSACNTLAANSWAHVAVVNDGTSLTLYINGSVSTTAKGGYMGAIATDLYIGRRQQGIFSLNGWLDEIKWWTVARTPAQVCADAGGSWNGASCSLG